MRRIAIVTSGGETPGMNPAIRALVCAAEASGMQAQGVRRGFEGLIEGDFVALDAHTVADILPRGGSMLGTHPSPRFRTTDGRRQALTHLDLAEVDALVVIGGDGSLRGADALAREGHIRVVGVPATIENDLAGCDAAVGFDTAANVALAALDRIRAAAADHERVAFVEVAGRHTGWVALHCGIAGGASVAVVPERPADLRTLREHLAACVAGRQQCCLVVVSEGHGAGDVHDVAEAVADDIGSVGHRVVALTDEQRGGTPTLRDRVLAGLCGDAAVSALLEGANRVMVGTQGATIVHTPLDRTWGVRGGPPDTLFALLERLAR